MLENLVIDSFVVKFSGHTALVIQYKYTLYSQCLEVVDELFNLTNKINEMKLIAIVIVNYSLLLKINTITIFF